MQHFTHENFSIKDENMSYQVTLLISMVNIKQFKNLISLFSLVPPSKIFPQCPYYHLQAERNHSLCPPTPPQPSGRVFLVSIPQEKGGGNYDNLNNESKNFRLLKNWDSLYAEQEL